MENSPRKMARFRRRITHERNERDWSQAEVAKKLTAMGIDNMHISTIAKVESGAREIKLDEAAAMAELFGASLDAMLGRKPKSARDLVYLLGALEDQAFSSRAQLDRTSRSLSDRLEDIPPEYEGYDALTGLGREFSGHLDAARAALDKLIEHFIGDIEHRAAERLKEMSTQELEQLEKSIPPPDEEPLA